MTRRLENPTYALAQAMLRGDRCGMCGRADLRPTDYAVRDGRIVDVPRRLVPRLCELCAAEFQTYRRAVMPRQLQAAPSVALADALAAMVRPGDFTLFGYASLGPDHWHTLAAGYVIVHELHRRAVACTRQMRASRQVA